MGNEGNKVVRAEVHTYTPADISDTNIKFKIPLYQRLFAWKKGAIEGLLGDLLEHFTNSKTCSEPYYLGIITQIYDSSDGYLVVLDGQQRITVLMLLAAYFSQKNAYWRRFLFAGDGYDRNRPAQSGEDAAPGHDKECQARLYPVARPEDKDCFLRLIYQHQKSLKNMEKTLLEEGYETIENFLSTNFSCRKEKEKEKEKEIFSRNIFDRVTLLATSLSPSYLNNPAYLNRYFEIMNSNYKNLEQHEVLKVQLATGAQNARELFSLWKICENFSENVIEILEKKQKEWQQKKIKEDTLRKIELPSFNTKTSLRDYVKSIATKLQEPAPPAEAASGNTGDAASRPGPGETSQKIADIEKAYASSTSVVTTGGRSIINFPQFLLLALDIFLERKKLKPLQEERRRAFYNPGNLLETFKDKENDTERTLLDARDEFYDFMLKLRVLLDLYVIRRDGDLKDSYSVLLGKLKDEDRKKDSLWGPERAHCRLAQYQAMLDAAFPERFYIWLKPYLTHLYELHFGNAGNVDGSLTDPDTTAEHLLKWLKDRDNRHALKGGRLADVLWPEKLRYNEVDRYWFWRLDYYLWEGCREGCGKSTSELLGTDARTLNAARAYRMRANRSIEHLYPQNPADGRPRWDEKDLHSFGNLAMISSSFNSQQSNESEGVKFQRIKDDIRGTALQSLKLLAMYHAAGDQGEGWTEVAATAHETRMIEILLDSFQQGSSAPAGPLGPGVAASGEEGAPGCP